MIAEAKLAALAAAVVADIVLLATRALDVNTVLNVLVLVVAALAAIPVLKARRKDAAIQDLETTLKAKDARLAEREADLKGAEARANQMEVATTHLREQLAAAEAKYEEQAKYTAKGAVTHMEEMLADHSRQVAERHERMLTALDALTEKIVGNGSPPSP